MKTTTGFQGAVWDTITGQDCRDYFYEGFHGFTSRLGLTLGEGGGGAVPIATPDSVHITCSE